MPKECVSCHLVEIKGPAQTIHIVGEMFVPGMWEAVRLVECLTFGS